MPASQSQLPKNKGNSSRITNRQSADAATKIRLDPRGVLDIAVREHKGDVHKQVSYFFKHYPIPASQGRARVVSSKTTTKYVLATHMMLDVLAGKGVKLHSVNDLTSRHLLNVMRYWEADEMASSSLATYFSVLKRFMGWVGVKLAYDSVHQVLVNPQRGKRVMSATTSRAWSANGVDFQAVLQKVHAIDPLVALQLEMVAAFGLRVMESCAMRPIECDRGNHLAITYGAKGGRGRVVQIQSAYQREVLEKAKAYASKHNGFLRTNRYTQLQAKRRFYYVLEQVKVSKSESGVTAHGLRHEYANDMYTQQTGERSPVNHGNRVPLDQDREARRNITEALGHSRIAITSAYLGSHVQMDRANKKRLAKMNAELTQDGAELSLYHRQMQRHARTLEPGVELRIFVTGPAADGKQIHGVPIIIGCGYFSASGLRAATQPTEEHLLKLASCCQDILGSWCMGQNDQHIPSDVPRFELMFPEN
ncbi:hypothetical protein P245_20255 [Comamonas thiooxydans]|uniref:Tyr recombinase domain-containing protein n=1 Tax=Comamonas thiooxydans TaxID=363952 RepID=A0A0E3BA83_9BURK|nr:integrase domain-containing protein [Comamonas thiooxydans]KGG87398.1 hypothetical protein P245_20255 [Comamonas thiooxydans]